MEFPDGPGLSPRKVTYLKFIFFHGGPVRTSNIAAEFGVDPSTVTKTLAELAAGGFLLHELYHGVNLSSAGRQYAGFLVKRHRIPVPALTHHGRSDKQARTEVSRFGSRVSKRAIDRMCHAMGHPKRSGCGEITYDRGCLGHAR